jgi:nicotinate-nucleotide adenylyltransferase
VGVFGGTFDPPHVAHLALAESARDQLGLDQVLFVPAARPPHKRGRAVSDATARLTMTRLAVRGNDRFKVSTVEIDRDGPSFTIDTLQALRVARPGAKFYLLMGEDSLAEFHTWRDPASILKQAVLVVARRPGARARRHKSMPAVRWLDAPLCDISSSALRRRARRGASLRYLVPQAVNAWIERTSFYRGTASRRRAARHS